MCQYIMKNFTNPNDVVGFVKDMENQEKKLLMQTPRTSEVEKEIDGLGLDPVNDKDIISDMKSSTKELYSEDLKIFAARCRTLKDNITKIWGLVWGNCSTASQSELMRQDEFEEKEKVFDAL